MIYQRFNRISFSYTLSLNSYVNIAANENMPLHTINVVFDKKGIVQQLRQLADTGSEQEGRHMVFSK